MSKYYYLVSTLPMLRWFTVNHHEWNENIPFSSDDFMARCSGWLSESEFRRLNKLSLIPSEDISSPAGYSAEKWYVWETCLRNKIVKFRVLSSEKDAEKNIRTESDCFSEIDRGVQEAFTASDPIKREKALDLLRWNMLEDIESGHHFDFDKLCVYKLKLMLREKWIGRDEKKGSENLEYILDESDKNYASKW